MTFRERLRRLLPGRTKRIAVDLSPAQQIMLLALRRGGPQPYATLAGQVEVRRFYAPPADMVNGILTLESAGLIERLAAPGVQQAERRYRLTSRGRKALRGVQGEPRSVIQVWL